MRYFLLFMMFFFTVSCTSSVAAPLPLDERGNKPDQRITPGGILSTDTAKICVRGYSTTVRHTTRAMKDEIYKTYGITGSHHDWKIDHLVPLSLGGTDSMENLWPSSFQAGTYNASAKDRLELKIHQLVCHGNMPLEKAQKLFTQDWQKAYDRFCPTRESCPSYMELKEKYEKKNKNQ